MRDLLRKFEGQRIVYRARATEKVTRADGLIDVCLSAVEIRRLTPERLLDQQPVIVDHCWLKGLEPRDVDWRGLLRRMAGCARVSYYSRADRSVDLGLTAVPGIDLDSLWDRLNLEPDRSERIYTMRSATDAIADGAPYWSWSGNADKTAAALKKGVDKFLAESAMNLGALLTSPANGPCRRMRAADPFANLRRRSRKEAA